MDCADIKVEMYGGGQLDPLVIMEEGDESQCVPSKGSPALGKELGDSGKAALGEEVAGRKEQNEGQGDRKNDGNEGEDERKTATEDIGRTEGVRVEKAESCKQQLKGTKSLQENPKEVGGCSYGTEKMTLFVPPPPLKFK